MAEVPRDAANPADVVIRGPSAGVPVSGARVLVVDDDPALVRFLELYLEGHGFRVSSALTGEEGVERARSLLPDVILLDEGLPDLRAAEFLGRLSGAQATRGLAVMVLAAPAGEADEVKKVRALADDYLVKPFDIQELLARLGSIVTRRRQQGEATQAERLRTLREVIASISHEVNNPLAAILMSAEALARRHAENEDVMHKSRLIQDNALRIRDILKRLERVRVLASKPYVAGERILDLDREEEPR